MQAEQIKHLRLCAWRARAVFAAYLNTSASDEITEGNKGKNNLNGTSLKLLNLVNRKGLEVLACKHHQSQ